MYNKTEKNHLGTKQKLFYALSLVVVTVTTVLIMLFSFVLGFASPILPTTEKILSETGFRVVDKDKTALVSADVLGMYLALYRSADASDEYINKIENILENRRLYYFFSYLQMAELDLSHGKTEEEIKALWSEVHGDGGIKISPNGCGGFSISTG